MTIKNAPGTDVLAQRLDRQRLVAIQTKTASSAASFQMNVKDEQPTQANNEYYILVALKGEDERPDFYVLPRNFVSAFLWVGHRRWLSAPGRGGKVRKDGPRRSIHGEWVTDSRERWDLLDVPTERAIKALQHTEWVAQEAKRFKLPPNHPGL